MDMDKLVRESATDYLVGQRDHLIEERFTSAAASIPSKERAALREELWERLSLVAEEGLPA